MLENRDSGWKKTKKANESGPKKVEDLRKEIEQKARDEANKYNNNQSQYVDDDGYTQGRKNRDRADDRDDRRGGNKGGS
jgi:hypothetical protein